MTINTPMELLAPAGTEEAFMAALHNGADAIYLGAGPHHARQSAGAITEPLLFSLAEKAHMAGVRVHLTLNTLLAPSELKDAFSWAERAWAGGVDAIIVQDIGLLGMLHRQRPDIRLHASTQMSLHDVPGVLAAKDAGVSRVVLSRELSLNEITEIHRQTGMELEVFAHGALCVCWSGQCLMSQFIGGRSGNRGTCAQPCRLPWRLETDRNRTEGYLLSMKDLMALPLLPGLHAAGVTSIKIEGRMKSPAYVGVVTGVYRRHLDRLAQNPMTYEVDPEDELALRQVFSRGGFTRHYLMGAPAGERDSLPVSPSHPKHLGVRVGTVLSWELPYAQVELMEPVSLGDGLEVHPAAGAGKSVVSTLLTAIVEKHQHVKSAEPGRAVSLGDFRQTVSAGDLVYRTSRKAQIQRAEVGVSEWQVHRIPVYFSFHMEKGMPACLIARDDEGHECKTCSAQLVEEARERPLEANRVESQLRKTGNTPWSPVMEKIQLDGKGTLPVSEINAMRRVVMEKLTSLRTAAASRSTSGIDVDPPFVRKREILPMAPCALEIAFSHPPDPHWLESSGIAARPGEIRIMMPLPDQARLNSIRAVFGGEIWIQSPTIIPEHVREDWLTGFEKVREQVQGVCAGNPGMLRVLRHRVPELPLMADSGMNLWNGEAVCRAKEWGADLALLSPEWTPEPGLHWPEVPLAAWVYGRVPVMVMAHCPGRTANPCNGACADCGRRTGSLTDRAGAVFPYERDPISCLTTVYHHRALRWNLEEWPQKAPVPHMLVTDEAPEDFKTLMNGFM